MKPSPVIAARCHLFADGLPRLRSDIRGGTLITTPAYRGAPARAVGPDQNFPCQRHLFAPGRCDIFVAL